MSDKPASCVLHDKTLTDIQTTVQDIHHRLFIDNGKPCIQTRLDRTERIAGILVWITALVVTCVVGLIAKKVIG